MVLGLDISTSCTGWCVLTSNGTLIEMGFVPLAKHKDMFRKADSITDSLLGVLLRHPISEIVIEENLQAFRPGLSSAKTLMTLARFNGIVSYICYHSLKIEPSFINVNVARRSLGIKIVRKKDGGRQTKEQVLGWVSNELKDSDHEWPNKVLKSGPRKGKVVLEQFCYDMADAYVIARSHICLKTGLDAC